jgi:CMP-N,N'-diacetyllegionaminic acid synthase
MDGTPSIIALIPARSRSRRVPEKNIRPLNGHPLLAYAISAALEAGMFAAVLVSTDSPQYAEVARHYGAEVPFLRPVELAGKLSPDIDWVEFTLNLLKEEGRSYDCYAILRPTNPFRRAETIKRAWREFLSEAGGVDSLRAVEHCKQHPGKMWVVRGRRMMPLLPLSPAGQPWHSSQFQSLPEVFVQNASLEIAWTRVVWSGRTIAGTVLMPFFTQGYEGLDINDSDDWDRAEALISAGEAQLPLISRPPYRPG